jgi:hypothetical protein
LTDILLPSSVTTPTLLFLEPCVPAQKQNSSIQPCFWTHGQKIRTPEQFSSTAKELYFTVLNARHLAKGVIMGKPEGKIVVITVALPASAAPQQNASSRRAPSSSSSAAGSKSSTPLWPTSGPMPAR